MCGRRYIEGLVSFLTATATEALPLRSLLEERGCITESVRILVPIDRIHGQTRTQNYMELQMRMRTRLTEVVICTFTMNAKIV